MNTVSNATTAPVLTQQTAQTAALNTSKNTPTKPAADAGDQVTISEKGMALSKSARADTDDATKSGAASSVNAVAASTIDKAKATLTLQDTKAKIKSIQSRIEADKIVAASDPSKKDEVGKLNAQLSDLNTTESKTRVKLNA